MSQSDLYQALPSVDRLLKSDALQPLIAQYGHIAVTETLRSLLDQARDDIKTSHTLPDDLDPPRLVARVQS
ncbi:MAG: hypothetical protein LBG61_07590, partial [Burkholderiales bacterium]|nr:hypothetical protein [Burkholderiales bacterium]